MTTPEEVQALRDTIATLRQRIADLESAQTLGAADRVILREMREPMTRAQIAEATGMHPHYINMRLDRMRIMGAVEVGGSADRKGSGPRPWLWRVNNCLTMRCTYALFVRQYSHGPAVGAGHNGEEHGRNPHRHHVPPQRLRAQRMHPDRGMRAAQQA